MREAGGHHMANVPVDVREYGFDRCGVPPRLRVHRGMLHIGLGATTQFLALG